MDPYALMRSWSNSQLRWFLTWLDQQMNRPSRSDYYLMQIAGYLRDRWDGCLESMQIRFSRKPDNNGGTQRLGQPAITDPALATTYSRSNHKGLMCGVTVQTITRSEAERRRLEAVAKGASETDQWKPN